VHEVREECAAKWVVAEILNHGSAVRIGARSRDLFPRDPRKSRAQHRCNRAGPHRVHHRFVREHRVSGNWPGDEGNGGDDAGGNQTAKRVAHAAVRLQVLCPPALTPVAREGNASPWADFFLVRA
jgi:hypothetical protein